jgi:hypothetical protein
MVKFDEFVCGEMSGVVQGYVRLVEENFELTGVIEQSTPENRESIFFVVRNVSTDVLSIVDVVKDKGGVRKLGGHIRMNKIEGCTFSKFFHFRKNEKLHAGSS